MKFRQLSRITITCLVMLSLSGCIIHIGGHSDNGNQIQDDSDLSSVLGNIEVDDFSQVGDVSTVNGRITIGDTVTAKQVETVNGNIILGENVSLESASTVNGKITANTTLRVNESLSTVNGDIKLASGGKIGDEISTVNGDIELVNSSVAGNLETKNGNVSLLNGTQVFGDIIFYAKDDKSWFEDDLPTLTIDANSQVKGDIILHRNVILEIENQNSVGKIVRDYPNAQ